MSWSKRKLGELCEITSSKRIFYSEYVERGVPFYRSKEIIESSQGMEISEPLFISEEKYAEIKNKFGVPTAGDTLFFSIPPALHQQSLHPRILGSANPRTIPYKDAAQLLPTV